MSIYLSKEFCEFVTEAIPVGQKWFSNENRKHIYRADQSYYSRLDFDSDTVFLQPLIMSYFLNETKETTLEQLLFDQLTDVSEIKVVSDKNGNIYLSGTGHFSGVLPNQEFTVKKEGEDISLFENGAKLDQKLHPIAYISGTSIELPMFELPYVRSGITYPDEVKEKITFDSIAVLHKERMIEACAIIEKVYPQFFDWLQMTIRSFQVMEHPEVWSFASISTLGISYFSANPERSILFFLEDIIHQSAHNVFYSVNYFSKEELFAIPTSSSMDDFLSDGDPRNIYGVFHGLFTQVNINIFFSKCLELELFKDDLAYELIGRLSDNMNRWKVSLEKFGKPNVLSEIGQQYHEEFKHVYEQIYAKWGSKIDSFDTTNQPYIFSFQKFVEANPKK